MVGWERKAGARLRGLHSRFHTRLWIALVVVVVVGVGAVRTPRAVSQQALVAAQARPLLIFNGTIQ